jgi:6-phosphogluconolactonase
VSRVATDPRIDARGAQLVLVPLARDVAGRSATLVLATLGSALGSREEAHVALTGGSMPAGVFRILAAPRVRDRLDWARVHFWWGDDRFVPPDDPLCNFRIADMSLFVRDGEGSGIRVPEAHIHPFPLSEAMEAGRGPAWCARRYAEELRAFAPIGENGWPRFDLVLLGMGPDGHVLSVFPGSRAFDADELALAIPAPTHVEPYVPRVTLNPAVLGAAARVLVMVAGPKKSAAVEAVLTSPYDPRRRPAQLALRPGATWVLDAAAMSQVASRDGGAPPEGPDERP